MRGSPVMERDFLGLLTAKEEDTVDYAQTKESRMQWSFSNVSGPSQYMSFWGSREEGTRKNVHDQFDSNQRTSSFAAQKNVLMEKSVGTPQPISVYPGQPFIAPSNSWSNEMKMYPSSKQLNKAITVTTSPSVVPSRVSIVGQNVISSPISPQPLGGVVALPPVSVLPTTGSVIGTTDLRTGRKKHHGDGLAQLTIFYAGSVSVYNDVSPEKAQAIMLLAGNGPPVAHHKTVPEVEVSEPFMKPIRDESSNGNRAVSLAFLSLPRAVSVSPVSVSPQSVSSSQRKPICNLELASRPLDTPVITYQEPPKTTQSLVSSSEPLFSSVALPQARKASLARFLEKRKERVTTAAPYPVSCRSPESSISKV